MHYLLHFWSWFPVCPPLNLCTASSIHSVSPIISSHSCPTVSSLSTCSIFSVERGEERRERGTAWNTLASEGISVSLWEPYWLPSFMTIPPSLPPFCSCTNLAFSFSWFLSNVSFWFLKPSPLSFLHLHTMLVSQRVTSSLYLEWRHILITLCNHILLKMRIWPHPQAAYSPGA